MGINIVSNPPPHQVATRDKRAQRHLLGAERCEGLIKRHEGRYIGDHEEKGIFLKISGWRIACPTVV